ncbi:tetratricopeptide repeat protein [Aliidiomarina haloalkalitolerans]|nr:tetratricopeptide repeat protein [Aliidiomarina haloalkalitolerans]
MSIINKMLRDIDNRENKQEVPSERPSDVYLPKPAQDRRATFVLAGGAVAVLVLLGLWWSSSMDDPAGMSPAQVAVASEQVSQSSNTNTSAVVADANGDASGDANGDEADVSAASSVSDEELVVAQASGQSSEQPAEQTTQEAAQPASPPFSQQVTQTTQATDAASSPTTAQVESAQVTSAPATPVTPAPVAQTRETQTAATQPSRAATTQATQATQSTASPEMRVSRSSNGADSAEAAYREGMRLLRAGNQPAALQQFRTAVERDHMHHEARLELVVLLFSRGVVEESLELLNAGVILAPHFNEFRLVEARILQRIGQPDAALEVLNGTSAVLPTDADIFIMRAALATELGYYGVAVHSYQQLVSWRPDSGAWWLGLGYALELRGDKRDASEAYQRALRDSRLGADSRRFVMNRLEVIGS